VARRSGKRAVIAAVFAALGLLFASASLAATSYFGPANASAVANYSTPGFNNRSTNEGYANSGGSGSLLQIWEKHTDGTTIGSASARGDVFASHGVSYTQSFCGAADGYATLLQCLWS